MRLLTVGEAVKVLRLSAQQVRNLTVTNRTPEPGELYPAALSKHGTRDQYLFTEACVERVKRVRDSRRGVKVRVKQLPLAMGPRVL